MKVVIEPYECLCALMKFEVNGVSGDYHDFGKQYDAAPNCAPDYGCGNMIFEPKLPTRSVLDKYNITVDEYIEICRKLDCLSFGYCAWCS